MLTTGLYLDEGFLPLPPRLVDKIARFKYVKMAELCISQSLSCKPLALALGLSKVVRVHWPAMQSTELRSIAGALGHFGIE